MDVLSASRGSHRECWTDFTRSLALADIAYLTSWQCKPVRIFSGLQFKAGWKRFALGLFSYNPAGKKWFGFEHQTLLTPRSSLTSLNSGSRMTLNVMTSAATAASSQRDAVIHRKVAASFDGHEHLPPSPSSQLSIKASQPTTNFSISCKTKPNYTMPTVENKYPGLSAIPETLISDILSACHSIDRALAERKDRKPGWDVIGPLCYLSGPLLLRGWENDLESLSRLYREGCYTIGEFEGWLKEILPAVDKLEEGRDKLAALFDEGKTSGNDVSQLEKVYTAVEKRCGILERAFKRVEMRLR